MSTPADPIEAERPPWALPCPELGHWREGNTGTEGVWRFDGAAPGLDLLVTALVHGNELCGAWAVLAALEAGLRPRRGALTLAFCNLEAFDRFDPAQPDTSRALDHDLNRLWGSMPWRRQPGPPFNREQRRVLQLMPFAERADWLLDLHSMGNDWPPLVLTGLAARHVALARQMGAPAMMVADGGHAEGARLRDHGRFGIDFDDGSRALLVECGWHGAESSRAVALDALARFLDASGAFDAGDLPAAWLQPTPAAQQLLEVTHVVTTRAGEPPRFAQRWRGGQTIAEAGTLLGWNGGEPFHTPYDDCTLVMPGLRQATPGKTIVRLARTVA